MSGRLEGRGVLTNFCPTGKMGDAWDAAQAAVYLASDDAKYVTGACLVVGGGLSGTAFLHAG